MHILVYHLYVNWRTSWIGSCHSNPSRLPLVGLVVLQLQCYSREKEAVDTLLVLHHSRRDTQVRFGLKKQLSPYLGMSVCDSILCMWRGTKNHSLLWTATVCGRSRPNQRKHYSLDRLHRFANNVFTDLVPSPSKRQPKSPILCSRQSTCQLQERRRSREYQQSLGRGSHIHAKE